jgi:hypothetical protein
LDDNCYILASDLLYYGDDGCNIKAIDWRKGRLRKIANHAEDIGFTDAVAAAGDLLVASTYDIDTGLVFTWIICQKIKAIYYTGKVG